jgi:glycosyltransferase involved in cell wall biosynthesis
LKKLVVASNMFNEIDQVESWYDNMVKIADGGILIVDTGSDDGTKEFFEGKEDVVFITDDIILREGYGNSRNHLRAMSRKHYPDAHWMIYLDGDERIMQDDFHKLRFLKDYLIPEYDVIALPRLNRLDKDTTATKNDYMIAPDYQARMTRLGSHLHYIRKLHENIVDYNKMYAQLNNPKIHHFHRSTDQKKRDYIGKMCAKLHTEDEEWGKSYPEHHKEAYYRDLLEKEGL